MKKDAQTDQHFDKRLGFSGFSCRAGGPPLKEMRPHFPAIEFPSAAHKNMVCVLGMERRVGRRYLRHLWRGIWRACNYFHYNENEAGRRLLRDDTGLFS